VRISSRASVVRVGLSIIAALILGYLGVLAWSPGLREHLPVALQWFGQPGSWVSITIATVVLATVAAAVLRTPGERRPGAPIAVVAGLGLLSLVYGLASYWDCHDDSAPRFFRPLMWTASLVKGGTDDRSLGGQTCPFPTPVALEVARMSALAAVFLSVAGVAAALFQSRLDRLRVYVARSVTAVVDMDDDARSMVSAVARTLDRRSTLAVITANPERPCMQEARAQGARVLTVDFGRPQTLTALSLWGKLDRLYLLSADPSSNLLRLGAITEKLDEIGTRERIPLIVRIDDPWQAEAWRARHFGGSQRRWAADAVGMYEVTARQLLDRAIKKDSARRVFVCGASRLTLALCSDLAQRQLEYDYYAGPDDAPLPELILVAENAAEYREDHEHARRQLGVADGRLRVGAVSEAPSVSLLSSLLSDGGDQHVGLSQTAVILVDTDGTAGPSVDATTGTRLAARFPKTPIYAWDPDAEATEQRLSIVGRLSTYRLTMDLPHGQAQDAWERAAQLIHDRYAAGAGRGSAAGVPWADLDEFYRESNRRQVRNTLWMVERIGGHTWNTWDGPTDPVPVTNLRGRGPLDQLRLMGFDRDAALKMAQAEHEDWSRYYRKSGWRYGMPRDDARKIHDKLVDWNVIEADPERLNSALSSLATTLSRLAELGYRSAAEHADWQRFRRIGTVIAEQRSAPWSWTTQSGETLQAEAGDWAVCENEDTDAWSVRDDIFRTRYDHVEGNRWTRHGTVTARPARAGEVIDTLEGPVTAGDGDWVVRGERGEQWPVPAGDFASRYEGPVPD
jgi:hypothetical protein